MRIAILGDALDLQYAGIHVYLRGLLTALLAVDRENEYLLVRPVPGGGFAGVRELTVPIQPWLPGHRYLRAFTSIPRLLKKEKVDVVVEPAHFGPFCLPKNVRRITVIHDLTPVLFPQFHPFPSGLVHKMALPGILKNAGRIIVNSTYTQSDLEKHYPVSLGKTSVVLPGKEAIFQPSPDASVLEKYGIRQPYLLCVGTIEPRKNLPVLLKAFEQFREKSPEPVQLVLAGKPGWKNGGFFTALAASPFRHDVVVTGFVERTDLPALYSLCRIFVYPSLYEGFGLPVLEAMACGSPVLVSNTSSLPEVGGSAAQYFGPENAADLARQLTRLFHDEKKLEDMQKRSLAQAAHFTWEAAAHQFLEEMSK